MRLRSACFLLLFVPPFAAQTNLLPPSNLAELRQRLAAHVTEPRFTAAEWGVKISSLDTGRTLFEHNAGKLLSPASNTKLFTCAFALDQLGSDHRIKTSLYATNLPDRFGVLQSDLIVFGRGDPCINARRAGGDIFRALAPLVAALTNAGVHVINGDLIGEDSYLPGPPLGSGWEWEDAQHGFGAELSALTINDNVVELVVKPGLRPGAPCILSATPSDRYLRIINQAYTAENNVAGGLTLYRPEGGNVTYINGQLPLGGRGSTNQLTVHGPAGLFVALFQRALEEAGVLVVGRLRTIGWRERSEHPLALDRLRELGFVESPPLREIVRDTFKLSQNLYADLLLAYLGAQGSANDTVESAESRGARELAAFLKRAGFAESDFFFDEGSGLSRNNVVTAAAIVRLLEFMDRHTAAPVFKDALPLAGVDGTLGKRMLGTLAEKNVRAKTGGLRWANSLSGYVTTAAGERLAFAILLNRYRDDDPTNPVRRELDTVPVLLAGLRQHSRDGNP